jgi:hypothetical protein
VKKIILFLALAVSLSFMFASCATNRHMIGNGPAGSNVVTERQWYILMGLIPLNTVDTKAMAAGAKDYEIVTQNTFVDCLISGVTSIVTVSCRSVSVKK